MIDSSLASDATDAIVSTGPALVSTGNRESHIVENASCRGNEWLDKLLERLQSFVATRINRARDSDEEKQHMYDTVIQRLNTLSTDAVNIKNSLLETTRAACGEISRRMHQHFNKTEVQAQLKHWTDIEAPGPDADDFETIWLKGYTAIKERIRRKIRDWEHETGLVRHMLDDLTRRFKEKCQLLSEETKKLDVIIEGDPQENEAVFPLERKTEDFEVDTSISTADTVIILVGLPILKILPDRLPIFTAMAVITLPVRIAFVIADRIKCNSQKRAYKADKAGSMQKWTEMIIDDMFTPENIKEFIFETYFNMFELKINELCDRKIPDLIAADRFKVKTLQEDRPLKKF
ncbi:hypothetical protein MAR_038256 [Mya arenaria]|uniref:Uncharacterized protein n=1 Tax=Mya arenaria TaxID=6604 RepID=A0ABY7FSM3_MYAAR|nr:hypothetical protein MAR_038256 [Mya arenaria]